MQIGDRVRFVGTSLVGEAGVISHIDGEHAIVELTPTIKAVRAVVESEHRTMTVKVPLHSLRIDLQ